jgi:hypothetical protein
MKRGHNPAKCLIKKYLGHECSRCKTWRRHKAKQVEHPTKRTFYIVRINCDCSSDIIARTSTRWMFGPRCPTCQQPVGCLEYAVVAKVRAVGARDALRLYEESTKAGK